MAAQSLSPLPVSPSGEVMTQAARQAKPVDTLDAKDPLLGQGRALENSLADEARRLLLGADSYEAAHAALLAAYPDWAIDTLEAALFQAIANSALLAEAEDA